EMTGVAAVLQRIEDQQVQPGQAPRRALAEGADVRAIGNSVDPEAQRDDIPMRLWQWFESNRPTSALDAERFVMADGMCLEDRWIGTARRSQKTIVECGQQAFHGRVIGMNVDEALGAKRIGAKIVNAVNMVRMRVRIDNGV